MPEPFNYDFVSVGVRNRPDQPCLTPGALYLTGITPERVTVSVAFPDTLFLTEADAADLEEQLHSALEGVLAPLWPLLGTEVAEGPSSALDEPTGADPGTS